MSSMSNVSNVPGTPDPASGAVRIVVVMLTLDQREMTLACLERLLASPQPSFRVLLWDNGSVDGTAAAVRERHPEVLVHRHPANLGVAPGRNAAAELARAELDPTHLLFLDNDMEVDPAFVAELYAPFTDDEAVGQTQAKLRFMKDRERLNDGGGCRIRYWLGETLPVGFGEIDRGQYDTLRPCVAGGGAMMVRADLFFRLGGFDTVYGYLGPEDIDFSLRLAHAGYRVLFAPRALAYHGVAHTLRGDYGEGYARLKAQNWFRFMRRHATPPQRLGFYLVGIPLLGARLVVREARRGNLGAVRGLLMGGLDYLRSRGGASSRTRE
jgi:GT2 family glycosyltransferase